MPISDGEWVSIRAMIESVAGTKRGEYFTTGTVIKRDVDNKLVWLAEFGDQPVPLIAFNYNLKYYDTQTDGTITRKNALAEAVVPEIGEIVIVAKELGVTRLPRCIGVLRGRNWIDLTES